MTETERDTYDPFSRGRFPVGVATVQTPDTARGRVLPCEIWYPAAAHHAGGDVVAALDHWEVVAEETWRPRLARGPRSPHPMSSGGSGRWWRWRRVAAPSRGPGSFRRSWRSGGLGTC